MNVKIMGKAFTRSSWNGTNLYNAVPQLLSNPEIRKDWEVSDEQYEKIKNLQNEFPTMLFKHPAFVTYQEEMKKIRKPDDPNFQNADEKTMQKLAEIYEQYTIASEKFQSQEMEKLLTPKQKQKIKEFKLAILSETPMVSATVFEGLDLSEEQKKKMAEIKKELEPDFEHMINDFADIRVALTDKVYDKLEKEYPVITDHKELSKKLRSITESTEYKEAFQKMLQEQIPKGQQFVTRVKFKMFDVLTDEQMKTLQDLIDNPPDYVKTFIAEAKKFRGKNTNPLQSPLHSWQPGEPIPEEYKKHRATRKAFPSEEK
jgi:Spy/CpxP family protein refolding chaperone